MLPDTLPPRHQHHDAMSWDRLGHNSRVAAVERYRGALLDLISIVEELPCAVPLCGQGTAEDVLAVLRGDFMPPEPMRVIADAEEAARDRWNDGY